MVIKVGTEVRLMRFMVIRETAKPVVTHATVL